MEDRGAWRSALPEATPSQTGLSHCTTMADPLASVTETNTTLQGNLVQFSAVIQSCPTPFDTTRQHASLPVHHKLPEFTQTHVHQVGDAIQPFHPLWSPSPPAPNISQGLFQSGSFPMTQLFASGGQSTGVSASASVLPMNTQD